VLVSHGKLINPKNFSDVLQGKHGEMNGVIVFSKRCIVHREEIIKLTNSWIVLTKPKGILYLLHFVDLQSLIGKLLFDTPFYGEKAQLDTVVCMRLKKHHIVNANMLELFMLAVWNEIAKIS
jgi:hypothetical protein